MTSPPNHAARNGSIASLLPAGFPRLAIAELESRRRCVSTKFHFYIIIPLLLIGCKDRQSDVVSPVPIRASHPNLSDESFRFIGRDTTIQQVIAKLGSPDFTLYGGARPDVYQYYLSDGSKVCVGCDDGKIVYVTHVLFGHTYFPPK